MQRAVLLYNPHSGQRYDPVSIVERAAAVLREAGIEVTVVATLSAAEAGRQAKTAVAQGCDTVFACGGDGTIQDVAQGLIGSAAALAIIPLGTANVLAHDLGIPSDAAAAARAALRASPLRIGVGRVQCRPREGPVVTRHFLSVAGAGQDGYLFQRLASSKKQAFGLIAYFLNAFQVWVSHKSLWFFAQVSRTGEPERQQDAQKVTELLAVRLHNFGNLLRDLAPGASLLRPHFQLVLFETSSRWSYLLYIIRGMVGARWAVKGIELKRADHIRLTPSGTTPVYLQADGEVLGQLPAEISFVPDALTLLVPAGFASHQ